MAIVIHHNPDCSKSRHVLRIILDSGFEPVVVDYLETGWTRPQLLGLFAVADLTPRAALYTGKGIAEGMGLLGDDVSDDTVLEAMVAHPVLVNRPFVACPAGVRLCRPPEAVLDLLPRWPADPYTLEDGRMIIDANGKRLDG